MQFKEASGGEIPNQFAADAYDAIYIIKKHLKKQVLYSDMKISELNDAIQNAITEITFDGLTGAGMTWSETGEVNKEPKAVIIEDGIYVPFE